MATRTRGSLPKRKRWSHEIRKSEDEGHRISETHIQVGFARSIVGPLDRLVRSIFVFPILCGGGLYALFGVLIVCTSITVFVLFLVYLYMSGYVSELTFQGGGVLRPRRTCIIMRRRLVYIRRLCTSIYRRRLL